MKRYLGLAFVLVAVLTLSACSYASRTGQNNYTPVTPLAPEVLDNKSVPPAATPVMPNEASITIQDFAFNPATVTVAQGAVITWTNKDASPHQISAAAFNSGQLVTGQTFSVTLNNAGTFAYNCSLHPSMRGTIIVQ